MVFIVWDWLKRWYRTKAQLDREREVSRHYQMLLENRLMENVELGQRLAEARMRIQELESPPARPKKKRCVAPVCNNQSEPVA